jgi:hypothetical protein
VTTLSAATARRIALAAQGLAGARPARGDLRGARRILDRLALIQVDSVNVLCRAQELPLWARLGPHPRDLLPRLIRDRALFEYWGHEASLCQLPLQPLLRWRMAEARAGVAWGGLVRILREKPAYVAAILDEVGARGPIAASQLTDAAAMRKKGSWWSWGDHKRALELLFWMGDVTSVGRTTAFERVYDLPARVLPAEVLALPTPAPRDAQRALLRRAATALGIATAADLADYFRIKNPVARPIVAELVEDGALVPVTVEGWREPAFLDPAAAVPRTATAATLISPFDSLIWARPRAERLFDFRYRIEIYTPAAKRQHGYYVLPFLLGDRLVARVDLKADRAAGALTVHAAYAEAHAAPRTIAGPLAAELTAMAGWLGLDRVALGRRGDLAPALRAALRTAT